MPEERPINPPLDPAQPAPKTAEPESPQPLTKEDQLALYEEHLKESDWGHQPC